ncbi:MAG: glycosyltransferase family 4 protein [Luteolibacter sp.]|nr:glycosyltransferase family 4 protein [Luteolibacter sp.]
MRIFTCTPVAFGGGADFFARDSGLLCRGFQAIGVDSRAVMPGGRKPEDEADLIRTEYQNLEAAEWWRAQHLDGVVLYSWGRPKFRKVAAAIRDAGIFLVLSQDSCGLVSPLTGFCDWLHAQWIYGGQGRGLAAWLRFIKLTLHRMSIGLLLSDPLRARHLKCGNVISCVSPGAAEHYRKLCMHYGGPGLTDRVVVIPHAVESKFSHQGSPRKRQVVCVGRWSDEIQKRSHLLMKVMDSLLATDGTVEVAIAGKATPAMESWHGSLPLARRKRVSMRGFLSRDELAELLRESQVFYSPSAYESFGIAAAEALCSGCSVVAGRSVTMPSFDWFVSENSGRLADNDGCEGHATALHEELETWAKGDRDARAISEIWCERLHADKVAASVVGMMDL